jgi:hypothetical protein
MADEQTSPSRVGVAAAERVEAAVVEQAADTNTEPSIDDELGAVWDRIQVNNGSDRGDDGKFKSPKGEGLPKEEAPKAEKEPAKQPEKAVEAKEGEEGADKPEEAKPASVAAPAHLPQSLKAKWDKLDPEVQKDIADYTRDRDLKVSQIGRSYEGVKRIGDVITAAQKELPQLRDMPPERIAKEAMELAVIQKQLQANPVQTILQVAQRFGAIDGLRAMLAGEQPSDDSHAQAQLVARINDLEQRLAEASDPSRVDERVQSTLQQREYSNFVESLAQSKEHYAEVERILPALIQSVWQDKADKGQLDTNRSLQEQQREVFEEAYQQACYAIPSVRAKLLAPPPQAAPANDLKRSESARRAASINVTSAATGKERTPSEEELMAAVWDRKMAS